MGHPASTAQCHAVASQTACPLCLLIPTGTRQLPAGLSLVSAMLAAPQPRPDGRILPAPLPPHSASAPAGGSFTSQARG